MPFDRLVKAVELWAADRRRDDVFAQIGDTDYRPQGIKWTRFLDTPQYRNCYESAKAIVAHAGTGSIITALQLGKPILIMPRQASLSETRNDHQVATAKHFSRFRSVSVAWNEHELAGKLDEIETLSGQPLVGQYASPELLQAVSEFIDGANFH